MTYISISNTNISKKGTLPIINLVIMISLASVGSVLPSPALPSIASAYRIPIYMSELTITLFVLGYAISQLIYAPIANAYGRKKALYLGIILSVVGALISTLATSFDMLLIGRLIMAMGSGCGLNLTFTIINDFYTGAEGRKITAYVTTAFAILPGIAIACGGELTKLLGWRSCFGFLLLYSVVAIIFAHGLPETGTDLSHKKIGCKYIIKQYSNVILDRGMYPYVLLWGAANTVIYMMAAALPIIGIQEMGLDSAYFGLNFLLVTIGYVLGNIITSHLSHILTGLKVKLLGALIMFIGSILLLFIGYFFYSNILLFFSVLAIIYFGLPMVFSTAASVVVQRSQDKSTTSSFCSFLAMIMGFLGALCVSYIKTTLYWKIPVLVFLISFFILILICCINIHIKKN